MPPITPKPCKTCGTCPTCGAATLPHVYPRPYWSAGSSIRTAYGTSTKPYAGGWA